MNNVHMILQGKGGVGKSLTAVLVAQYLKSIGANVLCADTDPVNATFTQYKSLDVTHVDIAKNGTVLQTGFDPLMEAVLSSEADFVIDNGAATFLPLTKYLANNDIYKIFEEAGKKVFIHTVMTGGQAKTDTYNGFCELVGKTSGNAKIVVWENEFWGPVEYNGHTIESTKPYREAERADRIAGRVRIEDHSHDDAMVTAISAMTSAHLTLVDVNASPEFNFLVKNRLSKFVGAVFTELKKINWQ
ncbi:AAA family ATPase [Ralstonia solanacearum]|uniref:nucleotide-binding protein n=1 Tax=Ralstonia solanacearum TaxID=305 RepID=UPI001E334B04|nr:AAA family ATPase [Ralstonia solanacearum]